MAGLKVYIIEDDRITLSQISYFLSKRGIVISGHSETGENALKEIPLIKPDVILCDIYLKGDLDGIQTSERLAEIYPSPVLFMTANDDQALLERSIHARPYGFLKKPLRFDALVNTIQLSFEKFLTENLLKEKEKYFQTILSGISDLSLFTLNKELKISSWNDTAVRMYEYSASETIGNPFSMLFYRQSDLTLSAEDIFNEFQDRKLHRKKDGSEFYAEFRITALNSIDSPDDDYSVLIQNVHSRVILEQEKEEHRIRLEKYSQELEERVRERTAELKGLNDSLKNEIELNRSFQNIILKNQKNLLEAQKLAHIGDWEIYFGAEELKLSPEVFSVLEISENSVTQNEFLEIIYGRNSEGDILEHLNHRLLNENEISYEREYQISGRIKYLQIKIKPIFEEKRLTGILGTLHDETERILHSKEINKALEKEKELNRLKNRFVSMISHEFRTPLTVILTNVQLMEKFGSNYSEKDKEIRYSRIYSSFKRVNDLLEDVLQAGKLQEGKFSLKKEEIQLSEFIRTNADLVNEEERISVNVNIDEKPTVFTDRKLLAHIVTNLLSNALKYSPKESPVELNVISSQSELKVEVKDRGIGIPKDDLEKVFEIFHRAGNADSYKGTGLGLSLVKEYTNLLGGEIQVQSEENQGSVFTLRIVWEKQSE
ncbi:MAG TPA: ATP-binding protein [Leptospiraceae bacterium]|nr:ATP-binding protein [Leptospiraceae bacterium]HMY65714.1 ATP-binding protein [Leptospiraceae bacterium]HNF25274.1 ATP-binding protein [Leptospiraceae bacterium]HNM04561.1 ATP-binding protein [Leptospiraceae bacterium]HNN04462.1 ATP-binding protein [Leptospiraceae bacterium]